MHRFGSTWGMGTSLTSAKVSLLGAAVVLWLGLPHAHARASEAPVASSADAAPAATTTPAPPTPPQAGDGDSAAVGPAENALGSVLYVGQPNDDDADDDVEESATAEAAGPTERVKKISVKVSRSNKAERAMLRRYLKDFKGAPLSRSTAIAAELRLLAIGAYKGARCSTRTTTLSCELVRARVLRDVIIDGLPMRLLETDLRKRIFIKPGEALDEEESTGVTRLLRQRERLEDFLNKEGFVGAEVRLLVNKVDEEAGIFDVTVRIRGGDFVSVRRVDVDSDVRPLVGLTIDEQRDMRFAFEHLCYSTEGLLDGVFLANVAHCYNQRRLDAVTERYRALLFARGHVEARVRVEPVFVDATRSDDPACARSGTAIARYVREGLPVPPHCVDLRVVIQEGDALTVRFHRSDSGRIVEQPPVFGESLAWINDTWWEPISRALGLIEHERPSQSEDTRVMAPQLRRALTFQQASSTDDTEVELSRRGVVSALEQRGYLSPKVHSEVRRYDNATVVDYWLDPGPVGAVRAVHFVGNAHISDEKLTKLGQLAARPRSPTVAGTVSHAQLLDDESRLRELYARNGFPEADVKAKAEIDAHGDVIVTFFIDEGQRYVLQTLMLEGGARTLDAEVLRVLVHCQGDGTRTDPPSGPGDCKGTPLIVDELEADAERVANVYAAHGYPRVRARVETAFLPTGTAVRVSVEGSAPVGSASTPSPVAIAPTQATLGELFVMGATVTRDDVVLRELGLTSSSFGAPLDPLQLERGVSRLRRTGLFQSVKLNYLPGVDRRGRLHARLLLDERPAFTVDTSVGFSTERLWALRLESRHKNVLGTMLDIAASMDMGLFIGRYSQARVQGRWPRILGSNLSLSIVPLAVTYTDEPAGARLSVPSTDGGQGAALSWLRPDLRRRLFSLGSTASLDWRVSDVHPIVDDKLVVGVALELRYDWLDLQGPAVPPLSLRAIEHVDGLRFVLASAAVTPTQVATVTPRIAYTNLDNPFDPARGFSAEMFVRVSVPPIAPRFYTIIGTSVRGYYSFFERFTFAANARLRLGLTSEEPGCNCAWAALQNDLLRLGGERSVRGVNESQIGVLSPTYDQNLVPVTDKTGQVIQVNPGLYAGVINLELRYTLIEQLFIGALKPAVFLDAGVVTNDLSFVETIATGGVDTRTAIGFGAGLRYVLPVGPLSLDVAYSPQRQTTRVHITFGYMF